MFALKLIYHYLLNHTMKAKFILSVLCIVIMSASCSKDNDSDTPENDIIIGTWGIFEYLEEDGSTNAVDPRLSENQITFLSDGTLNSDRLDDDLNWENVGNGTYELTAEEETTEGEFIVFELLINDVLKTEYGNGEATFFEKVRE